LPIPATKSYAIYVLWRLWTSNCLTSGGFGLRFLSSG